MLDRPQQVDWEVLNQTTQERILALLEAKPELTQRMLADRVGLTPGGVKYHLTKLRAVLEPSVMSGPPGEADWRC